MSQRGNDHTIISSFFTVEKEFALKRFFLIPLLAVVLAGCCGGQDSVSSLDGVPIVFEKIGEGDVSLVLVHGWCCDQTYWRDQATALSDSFTVVTLDLAGHGKSGMGRTDYTVTAFGADVAAVAAALDLHQVYLIGHSMGGPVVVEAARMLPERVIGVIGIDTLQDLGWNLPDAQVDGFMKPLVDDFSGATAKFVRTMFPAGADTALVRQVSEDMAAAPPEVALSAMRNMLQHDIKPTLTQLEVPIWCLNANQTPVDFQAWKVYGPGYTAVLMEGVGHFLFMEQPEEFNTKLRGMIGRMGNK